MKSPCLLIADSHEIARQGYVKILRDWRPELQLHEASDLDELRSLMRRHAPDLLVMEIALRRQNSLEIIEELRALRSARPRVLVSTLHGEEKHGLQALLAGASGFVCKSDGVPAFVAAVDAVLGGRMHAREDLISKWRQFGMQSAVPRLSEREEAILQRLAQGLEANEISRLLSLSIKTVRDYRQRLMDKLQLHSLADLVRYGMSRGFVDRAC